MECVGHVVHDTAVLKTIIYYIEWRLEMRTRTPTPLLD